MLDTSNSLLEVDAYTNPTLAPKGVSPLAQHHDKTFIDISEERLLSCYLHL